MQGWRDNLPPAPIAFPQDVGCKYVLCGHSERRTLFADDDGAISRKVGHGEREGEGQREREIC